MKKLIKYLHIIWSVLLGNLLKLKVHFQVWVLRRIPLSDEVAAGVIVSLTSYGQRVKNNTVCYTLHSFLTQKVRAERIVLWLDEAEFSDATLPKMLRRLMTYGVEVRYCPNWYSYKKLLPTLRQFPEYDVITADDDIYYSSNHLSEMIATHARHPGILITQGGRMPAVTPDGHFAPYRQWDLREKVSAGEDYNHLLFLPMGGYGVYYPAGIFDDEIQNLNVIQALCPRADDLWFYVMGLRLLLWKENVRDSRTHYYQLDLIRQLLSHDRLYDVNVGEDQNDVQLKKLLAHYNVQVAELL